MSNKLSVDISFTWLNAFDHGMRVEIHRKADQVRQTETSLKV